MPKTQRKNTRKAAAGRANLKARWARLRQLEKENAKLQERLAAQEKREAEGNERFNAQGGALIDALDDVEALLRSNMDDDATNPEKSPQKRGALAILEGVREDLKKLAGWSE